jgi:glycosyltransferase involved in cell wall biosynthesis
VKFFSIIIPTFDAGATLAQALESILAQSFTRYEVFIQDGGSQDDTLAIAARYAPRFRGRLQIKTAKDHGVYEAMNRALDGTRGRWCYFLGADDILHRPEVLQTVCSEIRRKPTSQMVYGDVIMLENRNIYDGPFDLPKLLEKNICHQAIFYRREVFREIGGFNLDFPILADWDLNLRCFLSGQIEIHYLDMIFPALATRKATRI